MLLSSAKIEHDTRKQFHKAISHFIYLINAQLALKLQLKDSMKINIGI